MTIQVYKKLLVAANESRDLVVMETKYHLEVWLSFESQEHALMTRRILLWKGLLSLATSQICRRWFLHRGVTGEGMHDINLTNVKHICTHSNDFIVMMWRMLIGIAEHLNPASETNRPLTTSALATLPATSFVSIEIWSGISANFKVANKWSAVYVELYLTPCTSFLF